MAVVTKGLGLLGDAFEGAIRSAKEAYNDLSVEEIYKHLTDERYGKGRAGELERMQNLVTRKTKTGNFAGNPISIEDLEGRGFITSMSDRSDAGGLLTHIKGVELETPIDMLGGQGFMFNNQEAWAQAQGAGSGIKNVGNELRKTTGQNPILIPNRMTPTGGDFAGFNGEAMLSFAQSNMTGKQKDLLNKQMKKLIPSWKGIDSPTSLNDFQALPKVGRNAVMNMLDTKFRNNGGLSIGEGRLATTEARQINAPDTRIQNIAELDLDAPMGLVSHPAYTHGMAGRGLGTIKEDVPAYALNPQSVKEMRAGFNRPVDDVFNPTRQDVRSLQMGAKGGIITEGLLRRLDDLGVLGSTAIGTGGLLASMNSQAGVGGGLKNIMPAPQRMFDPTDKGYKPFLSDFDQVAGGRFLEMGGPDGPVDVTGRYPATANISVSPDGKPTFQVAGEERTGLPPNKGRSIKTNLFKKSAGWKWTKVPEGFDPNPAGNFPIISVEDGNKHYYTLDAQFPDGAELARYPDRATEPRLRPTRKGKLELGNKVGEIKSRGNIHPVYDKAVIREGAAGATALAALSSQDADADIPNMPVPSSLMTIDQLRNQAYQGMNANSLNQGLFSGNYDAPTGTIEAATNPMLQSIAGGLSKVDTPFGKPFESASNVLNRWAYGEGADNMDLFGMGLESLDLIPAFAPVTRSVGKAAKGLMGAF